MDIDKRLIIGGLVLLAVVVTAIVVMSNNSPNSPTSPETPGIPKKSGVAKKHAIYGTHLRQYPSCASNECGAYGDVSNCPKYVHPTLVGEDRAIYAIHNGTIHDPRLKSRMCHYNPNLLCQDDDIPETESIGMATADSGPGNDLQIAYGYNMRKALIEGGAPAMM